MSFSPHGFRIVNGSAYCVLSRSFVEYVISSKKAHDLLVRADDTYSPDECFTFFNQSKNPLLNKKNPRITKKMSRITKKFPRIIIKFPLN